MVLPTPYRAFNGMNRNVLIASVVVIFHVAVLWAMQTGLMRRAVELIVPVEVFVKFIEPPVPKVAPPPPTPPAPPALPTPVVRKQAVAKVPIPFKTEAPMPLVIADSMPAANAPRAAVETAEMAAAPLPSPKVATTPPAPARMELPTSNADYLQNPKPAYPAMSKRLGEQGKVVVRVFIEVDGTAQKAEIKQSSGFERLDQAALNTVQRWRYRPGKRAGVPEGMWFNVPISFVLE